MNYLYIFCGYLVGLLMITFIYLPYLKAKGKLYSLQTDSHGNIVKTIECQQDSIMFTTIFYPVVFVFNCGIYICKFIFLCFSSTIKFGVWVFDKSYLFFLRPPKIKQIPDRNIDESKSSYRKFGWK